MARIALINGRLLEGQETIASRADRAWEAARRCIEGQFDTYSQISAARLSGKPDCPAWRTTRCEAVEAWIDGVWAHYGAVKASIHAGNDVTFDPTVPGPCPWTIWQIATTTP